MAEDPTQPSSPNPEKQRAGPSAPLAGSHRRGPDERRPAGDADLPAKLVPTAAMFSRQIALAYEREAIRLRRFHLEYPAPMESDAPAAFGQRWSEPPRRKPAAPGALFAFLVGAVTRLIGAIRRKPVARA